MRVISYVGTAAFVGFFWYMLYQGTGPPQQQPKKGQQLDRHF